ncbi:hypothetical protein GCM10027275_24170 [Rhabdobacter roseus]|uniref:Neutral/alkaline non-lysosomal ceramidase N-terminal domain-containing protein n=1 Tax=Rhabdobacter roseus TaxID=1655419 RepID=A0A840TRL3_9BACT|nr:neutral/alkaline non-lysosomal ceramidase N-terminal domain-containing protein [Rhabdobacter roseus]MBB5284357.1 hypothetical protein [Rhabdobacter roseus]
MKFLRILLKILAGLLVLLLVLVAATVTTVDRTPYQQMPYYRAWKQIIGQVPGADSVPNAGTLRVGWAKRNITPAEPTPMAGYGNRWGKPYEAVHDSVYVRALVLDNGATRVALLAADLLIVPPTVTERLRAKLAAIEIPFEQVYLGATHSHNSVGGWGDTVTGRLFAGKYNENTVETLAEAMFQAIQEARNRLAPATLTYQEAVDSVDIRNRLVGEEGTIDPEIRMLQITTATGRKALLCSYGAHSTVLSHRDLQLSRDFPGALVDSLEQGTQDFALYLAGAVGSMGPVAEGANNFERIQNLAENVEQAILSAETVKVPQPSTFLRALTIPLPLREPTPRLSPTWALRSWVFRWAFGDYPTFIKALRVGNVLLVGVPCDFSGELMTELDRYAKQKGLDLIVTSFNGGYAGYITDDRYFERDLYETVTMSWYGPYNGAYFQEVIRDVIDRMQ